MKKRRGVWSFVRATVVGGVLFLLPLILAGLLIGKGLQVAKGLTQGLAALIPDSVMPGEVAQVLAGVLAMVLVAFVAGLVARTRPGQQLVQWLGNTVIASLPALNFARGFLGGLDDATTDRVKVVAVAEEEGYALGLVFHDAGEALVPVFLPGVPQWQSGNMRLCPRANVHFTDLGFHQLVGLARTLGAGDQGQLAAIARALPKSRA